MFLFSCLFFSCRKAIFAFASGFCKPFDAATESKETKNGELKIQHKMQKSQIGQVPSSVDNKHSWQWTGTTEENEVNKAIVYFELNCSSRWAALRVCLCEQRQNKHTFLFRFEGDFGFVKMHNLFTHILIHSHDRCNEQNNCNLHLVSTLCCDAVVKGLPRSGNGQR